MLLCVINIKTLNYTNDNIGVLLWKDGTSGRLEVSGDQLMEKFWLGPVIHLGGAFGNVLKLTTYNLINKWSGNQILINNLPLCVVN